MIMLIDNQELKVLEIDMTFKVYQILLYLI